MGGGGRATYSQNLDVVAFVLQVAPQVLQPGLDLEKRIDHSAMLPSRLTAVRF